MTTQAVTTLPARSIRDVLLAGIAGLVAPGLAAGVWSLLTSAIWGPGLRLAAFLDPAAPRPLGLRIGSLVFAVVVGALIGAVLARGLTRRATVAWWALWAAFAAGAVLVAGAASLLQPVILLFIASSALGFRAGARG